MMVEGTASDGRWHASSVLDEQSEGPSVPGPLGARAWREPAFLG
jgi:hypothetical protein